MVNLYLNLAKTPSFNIYSGRSHLNLAKEFTIYKGGRKGFIVYIYMKSEFEYKELKGSLFSSYGAGHETSALHLK